METSVIFKDISLTKLFSMRLYSACSGNTKVKVQINTFVIIFIGNIMVLS